MVLKRRNQFDQCRNKEMKFCFYTNNTQRECVLSLASMNASLGMFNSWTEMSALVT